MVVGALASHMVYLLYLSAAPYALALRMQDCLITRKRLPHFHTRVQQRACISHARSHLSYCCMGLHAREAAHAHEYGLVRGSDKVRAPPRSSNATNSSGLSACRNRRAERRRRRLWCASAAASPNFGD